MKRQLTASAVSSERRKGGSLGRITRGTSTTSGSNAVAQPVPSGPSLELASATIRTHTLVLSGELHHQSASTLEEEIERLCEEGVTGITLDLRELEYIDSIGVAVIAFRCGLCKRRGYDFAVIPGSRITHRALEQAGVTHLLPSRGAEG